MVNELLVTTIYLQNPIDTLLNKFTLRKTLRILSWINRFLKKCRKSKVSGPLTAEKVLLQGKFLIKRTQNLYSNTENFEISRQQLNLKLNQEGIFERHGGADRKLYIQIMLKNLRKLQSGLREFTKMRKCNTFQ